MTLSVTRCDSFQFSEEMKAWDLVLNDVDLKVLIEIRVLIIMILPNEKDTFNGIHSKTMSPVKE